MRLLSLFWCSLLFSQVLAQKEYNVDSFLYTIEGELSTVAELDSLNKALKAISKNPVQGADTLFEIRQSILTNNNDKAAEIDGIVSYGFYLVRSYKPQKAIDLLQPYYNDLEAIALPLKRADLLYAFGHAHEDIRENERGFELIGQAVEIYEEVGDSSYTNFTNALIAHSRVGFAISDYASSSISLNKAKVLALSQKDSVALRGIYQDLTILFSQVGMYDEAASYWGERGRYFSTPESNESKSIGLINLGRNLILQDRWEDALGNYTRAQALAPYSEVFSFLPVYNYNGIIECLYFMNRWDSIPYYFEKLGDAFDQINQSVTYGFLVSQSEFLTKVATSQYQSAEEIGLDLLKDARESSDGAEIMMHSRFMSELYEKWGRYKEAVTYNNAYVRYRDSIQNAQKTNALLLLQTQFETVEKENEILRLDKERELLAARVERNRLYRALLFSILGLLILSGVLIYYRIRQRQLIRMQQLRMGISSDLHDEVGSLLSGITMQTEMLDVLPDDKKNGFIKEIGENTRKAVSMMRDLVWSIDSRRDKIEDLKDKISDTCRQLLDPAGFGYTISVDEGLDQMKHLNPKVKKETYLIVKEALNNVIRHSEGDQVVIAISKQDQGLKVLVRDNGSPTAQKTMAGQGTENMRYRAQQMNATLKTGFTEQGYAVEMHVPF